MAYCGPRGVPYSHWLGGADEWDDLSRAAALAWAEREADRCPGCGLHRSDLPSDLREFPVKGDYVSCPGCEKKELTPNKPEGDKARHMHFRWVRRDPDSDGASRRRS